MINETKIRKDLEKIVNAGKAEAFNEVLHKFEEVIKDLDETHFTYKRITENEWEIFLNGEIFYLVSTPIFKILSMMIDLAERSYKQGKMDIVSESVDLIREKRKEYGV